MHPYPVTSMGVVVTLLYLILGFGLVAWWADPSPRSRRHTGAVLLVLLGVWCVLALWLVFA